MGTQKLEIIELKDTTERSAENCMARFLYNGFVARFNKGTVGEDFNFNLETEDDESSFSYDILTLLSRYMKIRGFKNRSIWKIEGQAYILHVKINREEIK